MTHAEVQSVLDQARPSLKAHGGNIELIDVDNATGIVKVKLQGACVGCPMSAFTMKLGIEKLLREKLTGINDVVDVTEYDEGFIDDPNCTI